MSCCSRYPGYDFAIRSRNSPSFQTDARTGLTKSILRAPNMSCSTDVAHCMNVQAASFCFEKLDIASDQIQTLGVGAFAAGLAANGALPRVPLSLFSPPFMK